MKEQVIDHIQRFVETYQEDPEIQTAWGVPIVGFASADDPLFPELNRVASPTHAVPEDFLETARTVIAWFIPFGKSMTRTNTRGRNCSGEWAVAYVETNEMIRHLSLSLNEWFDEQGQASVVIPATHNWDEEKLISDWSHRHVAYMAGIGNFGLNNMLITDKGCCGRVGSFITSADIPRDSPMDREACLFRHDGSCRKCIKNCVNDVYPDDYSGQRFNRFKCYDMCLENVKVNEDRGYADVCGKCLVGVPCSHMDPVARTIK